MVQARFQNAIVFEFFPFQTFSIIMTNAGFSVTPAASQIWHRRSSLLTQPSCGDYRQPAETLSPLVADCCAKIVKRGLTCAATASGNLFSARLPRLLAQGLADGGASRNGVFTPYDSNQHKGKKKE
jgi:hypothetical protein